MYLSYVDDSGRYDKKKQTFLVLAAVLVHDKVWTRLESGFAYCIEKVVPEEKWDQFEEFKASELYGGYGLFDGIPESQRYEAIATLLSVIHDNKIPVAYGAIDVARFDKQPYGSANLVDTAFRLCVDGIDGIVAARQDKEGEQELALLIADDPKTEKDTKAILRMSFRKMRRHFRPPELEFGTCPHLLDDFFFGNSKDSLGLQLADLCAYFIAKHLEKDQASTQFFNIFSNMIQYGRVIPNGPVTATSG